MAISSDDSVNNYTGVPMMIALPLARRPAAGIPFRIFIDSDIPSTGIYKDNGTSWELIASKAPLISGQLPIMYDPNTGVISIQVSNGSQGGYLTSTDWNTFNNKAPGPAGNYIQNISAAQAVNNLILQRANSILWTLENTATTSDARLRVKNTGGNGDFGIDSGGVYIQAGSAIPIRFLINAVVVASFASTGGALTLSSLAGVGNRMVIANASGVLSTQAIPGGGGTVTSVSVVTANGVSGSVATATTTPAITLVLGNITPISVVASAEISNGVFSTNTPLAIFQIMGVVNAVGAANDAVGTGGRYQYTNVADDRGIATHFGTDGDLLLQVKTGGTWFNAIRIRNASRYIQLVEDPAAYSTGGASVLVRNETTGNIEKFPSSPRILSGVFDYVGPGTTSFTINFGATAPNTFYSIGLTPNNNYGTQRYWTGNRTTTSFDVMFSATTSDMSFNWQVFIEL